MKKAKTLLKMAAFLLVIAAKVYAQSPQGIPYEAEVRDNNGNPLPNQNVSLRFSIHDGTINGTVVYKETQSVTTNNLGLFNLNIGQGTAVTGTFSGINWGSGAKFTQVEMDVTGGISYVDMGSTQMMSVPYALYAGSSGTSGYTGGTGINVTGTTITNTAPDQSITLTGSGTTTVSGSYPSFTISSANAPETDPKVNSAITNQIPRWNGSTLADGIITDNGTNIGIGTSSPAQKLDVNGTIKTTNLQMSTGAGTGKVLQSDLSGNASWINSTSLAITENDPQVSSASTNRIPKWTGSTLTDGQIYDNGSSVVVGGVAPRGYFDVAGTGDIWLTNNGSNSGLQTIYLPGNISINPYNAGAFAFMSARRSDGTGTTGLDIRTTNAGATVDAMTISGNGNVGIGTFVPAQKLDVNGTTKTINLQVTSGAGAGKFLQSDASGNATWSNSISSLESDPQVSSSVTNAIPKWNGTTLSDGIITDNGTNIGIGTASPSQKLDINGTTRTSNIQVTSGAVLGRVLQCQDGTGNASWVPSTSLTVTENDPKVFCSALNTVPRWDGSELNDGTIFDNGIYVGIGTTSPSSQLDVAGTIKTTSMQITQGAGASRLLQSNSNGFSSWVDPANIININASLLEGHNGAFYQDPNNMTGVLSPSHGGTGNTFIPYGSVIFSTAPNGAYGGDSGLFWDNSTKRLGIGTSSPANGLDVLKGIAVGYVGITAPLSGVLIQGGVGIGTTTPANKLDVEGGIAIGSSYSGTSTAPVNGAIIQGDVGIGTATPRGHFDVDGSGDIWLSDNGINSGTQSMYLPGNIFIAPFNGSNVCYLQARRSDNSGTTVLRLRTYNSGIVTEAMDIEGNGNVGIGTTSPGQKLEVNGTTKTTNMQVTGLSGSNNRVVYADANGNLKAVSSDVAIGRDSGPYTISPNTTATAVTASTLNVDVGDVVVIEAMVTLRLTGGSGVETFSITPHYNGSASVSYGGSIFPISINYSPGESASDHDNPQPISYLESGTVTQSGTLTFNLEIINSGNDNWELTNAVMVVRKL